MHLFRETWLRELKDAPCERAFTSKSTLDHEPAFGNNPNLGDLISISKMSPYNRVHPSSANSGKKHGWEELHPLDLKSLDGGFHTKRGTAPFCQFLVVSIGRVLPFLNFL